MGYILIDFDSIVLKDNTLNSWKNKKDINLLLNVLFNQPFLELKYYCSKGRKKIPFKNEKDIAQHILKANDLMYEGELNGSIDFYTNSKSFEERASLFFSNKEVRLSISFKKENHNLLEIKKYMLSVIKKLKNTAYFGSGIYATFSNEIDFPRIRPPKFYSFISEQAIINIFDRTYFELYPKASTVANLEIEKLIKDIEHNKELDVEKIDDIFIVTWVESIEEDKLKLGLSNREDYLNKILKLKPKQRFNELGEKILFNISELEKLPETEYLTYYSEYYKFGFKMLVLDENKSILENDLLEIKNCQNEKKLNDSRDFEKILLVVSSKEYVNKLTIEVAEYKVLYLDDELNCWDINPDGNWKN